MSHLKRNLMIALAVAAAVAATLIAILAGGHGGRSGAREDSTPVQIAAGYLGITPAQLRRRLRTGESMSELAASTPGHSPAGLIKALTDAEAKKLGKAGLSAAEEHERLEATRLRALARVRLRRRHGAQLSGAASYLGIEPSSLEADLIAGRSLAQVAATAPGRSARGLIAALVADRRRVLEVAFKRGLLTRPVEQASLATLKQRVTREVDRKPVTR